MTADPKVVSDTNSDADKIFHRLTEQNRYRAPDHGLRSDPLPMLAEYFRVQGLVSPRVTDETIRSIYQEAQKVAGRYSNLDPKILLSIAAVESNFDPECSSDSGHSLGLMQVQPQHHSDRAIRLGALNPFSIHDSLLVGADYFAQMVDRYGCYSTALIAYNAGPGTADRCVQKGTMTNYAKRVLSIYTDILGIGDVNE